MSLQFVAPLLIPSVAILLGVAVWFRNRASDIHQRFALFALSVALWTLSAHLTHAYAETAIGLIHARLAFVFASLIPLSFLAFTSVFPSRTPPPSRRAILLFAVAATAASSASFTPLVVRSVATAHGVLVPTYGPLHPVFGIYFISSLAYGLIHLARKHRALKGIEQLQVRYVFLGVASAGLCATITNLIVPIVFRSSRLSGYGPLFTIVLTAFIAHSIIRHRLMNIRVIASRGVTYFLAIVIAGGLFISLAWLGALLFVTPPPFFDFGLVLLIGLFFQPIKRWLQTSTDRYFFREHYDYDATIRAASRQIVAILDLQSLLRYVCDLVVGTVRSEIAAVYMADLPGRDYSQVMRRGTSVAACLPAHTISAESPLVSLLAEPRDYLIADELGRAASPSISRDASADLQRLGGELLLPIRQDKWLQGFFILGPKRSGDPYFTEDIDLLTSIIGQAATAIKNAQLHRKVLLVEEEKRRAERLAAVGALASGVAHEVRNPLVAIKTFAELLPAHFSDEDFRGEFSQLVVREIDRIDDLVGRLLDLGTEAQKDLSSLDLLDPLDETLALLRPLLDQAQIAVETKYEKDLPFVPGNPAHLKQLFLNLLLNAKEAMPNGGQLSITLQRGQAVGPHTVSVSIADTGRGIPENLLGTLFDPFVTTKPNGSGLGLSVCRGIAHAHGATIRATNNQSLPGATLVVSFPVADDRSTAQGEHLALAQP